MIDLEQLSNLLRVERENDSIQELTVSIENDIIIYLNNLRKAQDDCLDYKELSFIRDEYKNAMIIIEGLIERRFAKLVNYAAISVTRQDNHTIKTDSSDDIVFQKLCEQMKEQKQKMLLSKCLVI